MIYAGDVHPFLLSLTKPDGSNPTVTSAPVITIVRVSDNSAKVTAQAMSLITGTQKIYTYTWNTVGAEDGDYVAFVSYVADGITVTNRYLDRIRLGDSRITGVVAQDSTVAKDATVAKEATTAGADTVALLPNISSDVAYIRQGIDTLPAAPANETTLQALLTLLQDIKDAELGTWTIDKSVSPKVLTLSRLNGDVLAHYHLSEDDQSAVRAKF